MANFRTDARGFTQTLLRWGSALLMLALLGCGGGSGGGERGRQSLRRFAKEVMPAFAAA